MLQVNFILGENQAQDSQSAVNLFNGTWIKFTETTGDYNAVTNPGGYGAPNPESTDIVATRFIWDDYYWDRSILTAQTAVYQNIEYQATTTNHFITGIDTNFPPVIHYQTVPVNTVYIATNFSSALGTSQYANQTGRRLITTGGYLPDDTIHYFLNTDFGLTANEIFIDTVKSLTYEVYGGSATASGAVVAGTQYIVVCDSTDWVSYNNSGSPGGQYTNGCVFTGVLGQTTFTTDHGHIYPLLSSKQKYAPLTYYSELFWRAALAKANRIAGASPLVQQQANQMFADLQTIYNQYVENAYQATPINIDLSIYLMNDIAIKNTYINQLK